MNIRYVAKIFSPTGYAEFARNFIVNLYNAGIDISVVPLDNRYSRLNIITKDNVINGLLIEKASNTDNFNINIIGFIPPYFKPNMISTCKNIGFTMHETGRIPSIYRDGCNAMDAIFVPCKWNVDGFKEGNVRVPIYIINPGYDVPDIDSLVSENRDPRFTFYSIFTWNDRKNPEGLLKAYFEEFEGYKDVLLNIQSYTKYFNPLNKVADIRAKLRVGVYPKVKINNKYTSNREIRKMHINGDCYVSPHRGEGWGMPIMEAMACGKPTIVTGYSGNMDFTTSDNSMLLEYKLKSSTSKGYPKGAYDLGVYPEPSIDHLKYYMRYAFENREAIEEIGNRGRQTIVNNFNWSDKIGYMISILNKVSA